MTLTSNHKNNTFFGFPDPNYLNKSGINHIYSYFFHFGPKGSKIYFKWPITGFDLWRKSTNDQILNCLHISYHHVKNQTCVPKCNSLVLRHPAIIIIKYQQKIVKYADIIMKLQPKLLRSCDILLSFSLYRSHYYY